METLTAARRQAQRLRGLQRAPGRAGKHRNFPQRLAAQPFGHLLGLVHSAGRKFAIGVGDRSGRILRIGMAPKYQIHIVVRLSEAGSIGLVCDKDIAARCRLRFLPGQG